MRLKNCSVLFVSPEKERLHDDYLWSLALACYAACARLGSEGLSEDISSYSLIANTVPEFILPVPRASRSSKNCFPEYSAILDQFKSMLTPRLSA